MHPARESSSSFQQEGWDPRIAKTDEKTHTEFYALVSRLLVKINSDKADKFYFIWNSQTLAVPSWQIHCAHNIPHTVPDEATGALGSSGSHLTTCTQSHKGMRWFVQGHHTNHSQGQQSSSAPGPGSWTMMPLSALQQSVPCAINPSSRSMLNHSRIMTFLWEDNTSLQTWELGRKSRKISQSSREKSQKLHWKTTIYKNKICKLMFTTCYFHFSIYFPQFLAVSGTQK